MLGAHRRTVLAHAVVAALVLAAGLATAQDPIGRMSGGDDVYVTPWLLQLVFDLLWF